MQERRQSTVAVTHISSAPSESIIVLFKQAFPRHPASLLHPPLTAAFLETFARNGTFLVARDARTGRDLGFLIGGEAAVLDRTRERFIRSHRWRILRSFLKKRLSPRIVLARIGSRRRAAAAPMPAPYQLRFIAVQDFARGRGVGSLLVQAFEAQLPESATYHAWTLAGPEGAEPFYLARGFRRDLTLNGHLRLYKRL